MRNLFICLWLLAGAACTQAPRTARSDDSPFIRVHDGQFVRNGRPYYFIGTNFWYGPVLGASGEFGDRARLLRELDRMKAAGITNLRVLAGADGPEGIPGRVMPTLHKTPDTYDDTLLDGLDFFMYEAGKRDLSVVLYLTNNWDWSGGYVQYLQWVGHGEPPVPSEAGWDTFGRHMAAFYRCDSCRSLYKRHISFLLRRTNYYNGLRYIDDPHIMAWQLANEPRPMSPDHKEDYAAWIADIAAYIKSIDPHHLVSTGSEGRMGSEGDGELYARVHAGSYVDYLTVHIWPKNWGWLEGKDVPGSLERILDRTEAYLSEHVATAEQMRKPLVLEEFGLPRDRHGYTRTEPTVCRDRYYTYLFERLVRSAVGKGVFAGCNFWAWGGSARTGGDHLYWRVGDDYTGDPGQEEQGLNSVFDTDHTLTVVRDYARRLAAIDSSAVSGRAATASASSGVMLPD